MLKGLRHKDGDRSRPAGILNVREKVGIFVGGAGHSAAKKNEDSGMTNILQLDEYAAISDFIATKAKRLRDHEQKDFAKIGFDVSNWRRLIIGNRVFYTVAGRVFREILETVLPESVQRYPEKFGTGNPQDVLDALYATEPWARRENFGNFLQTEQFCWVVEMKDGVVIDRVLRIELFRQISQQPNPDGTHEFIGGAFHAYKHYSYNGIPLSTHKALQDIHPTWIVVKMTEAFFFEAGPDEAGGRKCVIDTPLDEKHVLRVVFYYEEVTGVYFLKTSYKKKGKKL